MPRGFNRSTPLGALMHENDWSVREMSASTGVNERMMSDYLAGRRPISSKHLVLFAAALGCLPSDLL